jgi:hypothetical protein
MRTRFGLLRNAFPLLRLARSRAVPPSGTLATGGRPLLAAPRSDGVSLGCSCFFCHQGEKLAGHVICSEDQMNVFVIAVVGKPTSSRAVSVE